MNPSFISRMAELQVLIDELLKKLHQYLSEMRECVDDLKLLIAAMRPTTHACIDSSSDVGSFRDDADPICYQDDQDHDANFEDFCQKTSDDAANFLAPEHGMTSMDGTAGNERTNIDGF